METHECFTAGCTTQLDDKPGNYYCDPCIEKQQAAQGDEMAAFDAYHRFADSIARGD